MCIASMLVLIAFFLSGIWFFAIGTEPEFELNTAEDPYSSTEGQGKRLILCFQSISILALSHTIQMSFISS
jgi:hypothetical protein